jgi:hypothetical protein
MDPPAPPLRLVAVLTDPVKVPVTVRFEHESSSVPGLYVSKVAVCIVEFPAMALSVVLNVTYRVPAAADLDVCTCVADDALPVSAPTNDPAVITPDPPAMPTFKLGVLGLTEMDVARTVLI